MRGCEGRALRACEVATSSHCLAARGAAARSALGLADCDGGSVGRRGRRRAGWVARVPATGRSGREGCGTGLVRLCGRGLARRGGALRGCKGRALGAREGCDFEPLPGREGRGCEVSVGPCGLRRRVSRAAKLAAGWLGREGCGDRPVGRRGLRHRAGQAVRGGGWPGRVSCGGGLAGREGCRGGLAPGQPTPPSSGGEPAPERRSPPGSVGLSGLRR